MRQCHKNQLCLTQSSFLPTYTIIPTYHLTTSGRYPRRLWEWCTCVSQARHCGNQQGSGLHNHDTSLGKKVIKPQIRTTPLTVISCKTTHYIAGRAGYVHYSTRYKAGNIQAKIRERRPTPIAEWSNALATPTVISCKTRCYTAGPAGYVHYSTRYKAGNIQAKIRERGPTPIAEWSNALARTLTVTHPCPILNPSWSRRMLLVTRGMRVHGYQGYFILLYHSRFRLNMAEKGMINETPNWSLEVSHKWLLVTRMTITAFTTKCKSLG